MRCPITELWEERRFLLDVAHWMLGDPPAAESVVAEPYQRWVTSTYGPAMSRRRSTVTPTVEASTRPAARSTLARLVASSRIQRAGRPVSHRAS